MSKVQIIKTEDLNRRLSQGGGFQFWNVLTDEYYKNELIAGSRRVPIDQIGREVSNTKLPKDAEIVVYCAGPECPMSVQAAEKLLELGFTNVNAYEGGLEEWKAAGLDTVKTDKSSAA